MEGTHGQQSPGKEDLGSEKGKSGCGGKRSPPVSSGDLQSVTGDGKDCPKDPLSSGLRNSVVSLCLGGWWWWGQVLLSQELTEIMKTEQHSWVLTGF